MDEGPVNKYKCLSKFLLLILVLSSSSFSIVAQENNVLNQKLTFRYNDIKISGFLKSITRKTGYYFTYDTKLVEPDKIVDVHVSDQPLKLILDKVFEAKAFQYSVIDKHIIIYLSIDKETPRITETGRDTVFVLSGTITDSGNGKPLPFATIGIKSKAKGTISNYEGEYSFNISRDCLSDTLCISYLGFSNRYIPVEQAVGSYFTIKLDRVFIPIPEVIIRKRDPKELINNFKTRIADNYGRTPSNMTAFYRESIRNKGKILQYSEAVLELYKSSYGTSLFTDQIKVYKSRKINNIDIDDTLTFKLQAGLDGCLVLDGIKNTFDFIKTDNYDDYNYRMTDIVNIGDEAAFVIDFKQKETITDMALPQGSIYINTTNYGIHFIEFEINPEYLEKVDLGLVKQSARGYIVKPRSLKYRVNYRYTNNRYYLSHVRGDLEFFTRKKKKLFGSTFNIFFEMAINDIDTVNVVRFAREERTPVHTIFSETITSYDPEFWGTDNFLRPEESIEDALNRINARLGKFSNSSQESGITR